MPSGAYGADDNQAAPPVLRPRQFGEQDEHSEAQEEGELVLPDPAFVPTAWAPDDEGLVEVQLRRTDQEELALPIYRSVESLAACCGEVQPWVAFPAGTLPELVTATEATGIIIEPNLREGTHADE